MSSAESDVFPKHSMKTEERFVLTILDFLSVFTARTHIITGCDVSGSFAQLLRPQFDGGSFMEVFPLLSFLYASIQV